jgi:hypothetical protein
MTCTHILAEFLFCVPRYLTFCKFEEMTNVSKLSMKLLPEVIASDIYNYNLASPDSIHA